MTSAERSTGQDPAPADLLVLGGAVLTLDAADTVHPEGAVAVRDDRIVAVGPRKRLARRFRSRRVIEAAGHLVLPGLVNAHTHAAMTLFRGLSDDQELITWLTKYMFPLEAKFVTKEFVRWGARLACWEMIASGTTTFADGYFFEEETARAADEAGLRAFPGQGVLDVPTPDAPDASAGLARAERFLAEWKGHPRITPSLFPHSCFTVTPETLRRVEELAERFEAPAMIHLAESPLESKIVEERYHARPAQHFLNVGIADRNWLAAHCVWTNEAELRGLAARGVGVAHCAESNMKLASGVAPVAQMLALGMRVGLGTDGAASNNDLDMIGEMATVAKLHKVHSLDPTQLPARTVLRLATMGGARALHAEDRIGSLEPGKKADLIIVAAREPNALPGYHPDSQLVYATRAEAVQTVVVDGRILMDRRRLRTLDTEAIRRHCLRLARRIGNEAGRMPSSA
jgi:5-methylthioadenosine/S-adenosylhomocysteine deaminase